MLATEMYNKFEEIRMAIQAYHTALDNREHGGVAQDKCIKSIESTLDMHWSASQKIVEADAETQGLEGTKIDSGDHRMSDGFHESEFGREYR